MPPTDPKTTTRTWPRQCTVAVIVAIVESVFRLNQKTHAPYYALFLTAPVTNLIEIWRDGRCAAKSVAPAAARTQVRLHRPNWGELMSERVDALLKFHGTRNFGSSENMAAQQAKARQLYEALLTEERDELGGAAISKILDEAEGHSDHLDVLCCLACFCPGSLKPFHERLVRQRIFYPGVIYHGAGEDISSAILTIIKKSVCSDHELTALAWIGDETVQRAFTSWRETPPAWVSDLFIAPHEYAHDGGWNLEQNGSRRNLTHEVAYPLVENARSPDSGNDSATVGGPSAETCRWCDGKMTALLSLADIGSFIPWLPNRPVSVLACHTCACFGPMYAKARNGVWGWHEANARPEYLPEGTDLENIPSEPLRLSGEKRSFLEAANWMVLPGVSFSQVGGCPTWIQDAEYPVCFDCSETMPFVGQISNEDFMEFGEGIYYMFYCPACDVTATTYQQS